MISFSSFTDELEKIGYSPQLSPDQRGELLQRGRTRLQAGEQKQQSLMRSSAPNSEVMAAGNNMTRTRKVMNRVRTGGPAPQPNATPTVQSPTPAQHATVAARPHALPTASAHALPGAAGKAAPTMAHAAQGAAAAAPGVFSRMGATVAKHPGRAGMLAAGGALGAGIGFNAARNRQQR